MINYLINASVFSLLGVGIFAGCFLLLDLMSPYKLWQELVEKQNKALAIFASAIAISIALIVSAAVHG